jgi:hypothetical protein
MRSRCTNIITVPISAAILFNILGFTENKPVSSPLFSLLSSLPIPNSHKANEEITKVGELSQIS